jgi:hypothetical protein
MLMVMVSEQLLQCTNFAKMSLKEFTLSFAGSQWTFSLDDEEDDEGMGKFITHMISFVSSRKRTLADVLKECQSSFTKYVKEDSDGDDGSGSGGEVKRERERKRYDSTNVLFVCLTGRA